MGRNREQLATHAICYPRTPGATRHSKVSLYTRTDDELENTIEWHRIRHRFPDPQTFRRRFLRRLGREVARASADRVVLSDEALFASSEQRLQRLRSLIDELASSVRVLCYLRRQDDHLISRYQQAVKTGSVDRLGDFAARDHRHTYDYASRLALWEQVVAPEVMLVRRFEPQSFEGGSLLQDFLSSIDYPGRLADLEPIQRSNESLDMESVEFLRVLNLYRVESQGARPGVIESRSFYRAMMAHARGKVLTLPAQDLDAFMGRWAESNTAVARRYFGRSDELFRTDRRTANTTVVQRLDPARVDHFLQVAAIPDSWHDGLRRMAKREAT
ncbi:hypothetical protein FXB39_07345 [Nocardioides sp. BGMRC 2183]|nr:hypothetical protein FXB39_07345 [Nocardioides sp. BGMRC 2183]